MDTTEHSAALLGAILEAAVDAIIVSDEKGLIVKVNPAACKMFLQEEEDLIGRNVSVLMPTAMAEFHDGYMQHHLSTGEKKIIGIGRDVQGARKDGSVFPLHLSVGHARVDGQRMFIAILHDLTERVATQNALFRSQRLDAVGQMTGGIAHDFNNLLTVIIGNLELMDMRDPEPAMADLIRDALDAAEMGADLTKRLMVFARKGDLKPVRANLRELCEDALAILKRTLGAGMRVSTQFAPDLRPVLVDPVQLQSALVNLALNARDAMHEKGELLITVENVSIDDKYMAQEIDVAVGDYVRLSVSDDGDGMSEEVQKRAFEPFFTTKMDHGGNGLGLAMVYGFVRQSGGHITLYSEPGHGTSFGLYFPALQESDAETGVAKFGKAAELEKSEGQTVLIVEDNPKVRRASVARLAGLGYRTEEATSGDEAFAMLEGGLEVDIVFSDLVMPGTLNGYALAKKVAKRFPEIRVLLTSGYASDVVTDKMSAGLKYQILHKPFRQAELAQRLQALLKDDPPD